MARCPLLVLMASPLSLGDMPPPLPFPEFGTGIGLLGLFGLGFGLFGLGFGLLGLFGLFGLSGPGFGSGLGASPLANAGSSVLSESLRRLE